jgi:hypothetical protein
MKAISHFLRTTILGGALFLMPIVVLTFLLNKAFDFARRELKPIAKLIADQLVSEATTETAMAIALIVILCLLAGLLGRTVLTQKIMSRLESAMLSNVPAYGYLKQAGSSMMGLGEIAEPRGARANRGAWRLGGQTDMVGSGLTAVFVPNSPNTFSGSVFLLGLGQGAATRSAAGEHPSLLGAMRQVEGRLSTLSVTIGANQLLWVSVYEACGRGTLEREQF